MHDCVLWHHCARDILLPLQSQHHAQCSDLWWVVCLQTGGPTAGVNVGVKLVNGAAGGTQFVELWEVGGKPDWSTERRMFYEESHFSGVIVVHDLTNRRSFEHMCEPLSLPVSVALQACRTCLPGC